MSEQWSDEWTWEEELTEQVDRLVAGEVTLDEFKVWYRERDALSSATPEELKAVFNEWRVDSLRNSIVEALKK
jgi:hypothetical protein